MGSRKTVNGAYRYRYTPFLNPKYVHPLALPLGELSPKVTERALLPYFPSPVSLRSAASPIGRGKRCSSLSHCACQLSDTPRPLRQNSPYSSQIFHYLTGQNQTGYGGDKGCAARNVTAVGAAALGAGRTDTVRPTADGHVLNRAKRLLLGIDGLSFPDAPLFQLPAHDPRRRINPGLVDIRHPGRCEPLHGVLAQQQLGSGKWIQHSAFYVIRNRRI